MAARGLRAAARGASDAAAAPGHTRTEAAGAWQLPEKENRAEPEKARAGAVAAPAPRQDYYTFEPHRLMMQPGPPLADPSSRPSRKHVPEEHGSQGANPSPILH